MSDKAQMPIDASLNSYEKPTMYGYPIWHQMDGRGWEFDVWKGESLISMIRFSKNEFHVTMSNGEMKDFNDLSDCISWVALRISVGDLK